MPQTSFWCWSQAPLPTRTGREFRQPDRWSRVCSVRSFRPSMPYMICRSKSPLPAGHRLEHEGEVLERLPVEPEPVERAQHEGGVADPGVAVVPVARPAGRLGQRGGGGRHDGAGRGVAQALERQGAALHVAAPGMVGERAVGEPVPPVADRGGELRLRLVQVGGRWPDHDSATKAALALLERRAAVAAGARRAEAEGRRHGEHGSPTGGRTGHGLVAVAVVVPHARSGLRTRRWAPRWPRPRRGPRCRWPAAGGCPLAAASPGARR